MCLFGTQERTQEALETKRKQKKKMRVAPQSERWGHAQWRRGIPRTALWSGGSTAPGDWTAQVFVYACGPEGRDGGHVQQIHERPGVL